MKFSKTTLLINFFIFLGGFAYFCYNHLLFPAIACYGLYLLNLHALLKKPCIPKNNCHCQKHK